MSINKQTISKTLIIAGIVGAILVVGVLVSREYNKNLETSEAQAVSQAEIAKANAETEKAKFAELETRFANLRLECEKGQASHALLNEFQRVRTPEPICGPSVTQ